MPSFRERPGRLALFLGGPPDHPELGAYYDHDFLDGSGDVLLRTARDVIANTSYSASYFDRACEAARALGA